MPRSDDIEIFFIASMMVIILIGCGIAVYFFVKTYKKEMREKAELAENKRLKQEAAASSRNGESLTAADVPDASDGTA